MATYQELRQASENQQLLIKVQVACMVAADAIASESTGTALHDQRLKWANRVFMDPLGTAQKMINSVLAKNKSFTLVQIIGNPPNYLDGASDAAIQAAVDASVNVFATVMA